jgi:hypothetical protein
MNAQIIPKVDCFRLPSMMRIVTLDYLLTQVQKIETEFGDGIELRKMNKRGFCIGFISGYAREKFWFFNMIMRKY